MARFDKSSTKSPQQDAALAASRRAKKSTAPSIEDTMFFPRLRRHAKWMFVFLAVALGGGFVLFGVGRRRHGRRRHPAGRRREQRPVGVERAEEDRGEPEGSRGVARALDRLPGRQQDGRGDRGAEDGRRAGAEGHERTPRAREPLPRPGERQAARSADPADPRRLSGSRPGIPGSIHVPQRPASPRGLDQHSLKTQARRESRSSHQAPRAHPPRA